MSTSVKTKSNIVQYLSFIVDNEEYCVDILHVQEIRGWEKPKPIPKAPKYLKGVLNLRSQVIPVVDLRLRFDLEEKEYTKTTVVIFLKVDALQQIVGLVVDAVSEVYSVASSQIKPSPEIAESEDSKYIDALALIGEKMIAVINMDKVFDKELLTQFNEQH